METLRFLTTVIMFSAKDSALAMTNSSVLTWASLPLRDSHLPISTLIGIFAIKHLRSTNG